MGRLERGSNFSFEIRVRERLRTSKLYNILRASRSVTSDPLKDNEVNEFIWNSIVWRFVDSERPFTPSKWRILRF
jgi:hypothetical protein